MADVPQEMIRLADMQQSLALDLYKEACQSHPNLVFCPISVCAALAMLGAGAEDATQAQVLQALKLTSVASVAEIHETFRKLLASMTYEYPEPENVDLVLGNSFCVPEGLHVNEEFSKTLVEKYRVFVQPMDFHNKRDESINNINSWIAKQTKNKIVTMVTPSTFEDSASLVILNASYMKGLWERKFNRENTNPANFRLLDGTSRPVDMMYQDGKFRYGKSEALNCRVLEMLYKGKEFSMVIILPDNNEAFQKLEGTLDVEKLKHLLSSLGRKSSIMVWIPRFQVDVTNSLNELLPRVGVSDMFSTDLANLSGISEERVVVSHMLHRTVFAVDEEGSEGSAATMTVIALMSLEIGEEFRANRPFLYLIRQNKTGAIIFMGRLTQPPPSETY